MCSLEGESKTGTRSKLRMNIPGVQGATCKETLILGLMQVQGQPLRVSASLNFAS